MLLKLTAVLVFIHIINSPQYLLQIFPCSFTVSSQQEISLPTYTDDWDPVRCVSVSAMLSVVILFKYSLSFQWLCVWGLQWRAEASLFSEALPTHPAAETSSCSFSLQLILCLLYATFFFDLFRFSCLWLQGYYSPPGKTESDIIL